MASLCDFNVQPEKCLYTKIRKQSYPNIPYPNHCTVVPPKRGEASVWLWENIYAEEKPNEIKTQMYAIITNVNKIIKQK